MSEQFTLKIKVASSEKPAREFISRLAAALNEDDHAAVRQMIAEALKSTPRDRDAKTLVRALLLPCSEYGTAAVPFLDALCGALEDSGAYLQIGGKTKLGIELSGEDNGSADAAAYLLALLHSLSMDILEAKGKGFTWVARWACDTHGVLRTAAYEPLDEGQKIDPKADDRLRRKAQDANKKFLATPLRGLADALPVDRPMEIVLGVGFDQILGCSYAELMSYVAALPDCSGHDFLVALQGRALTARNHDDQLSINVWNAPGNKQTLELTLSTRLSKPRMHKHFTQLLREVQYNKDLGAMGWFDWESSGIKLNARLSEAMFELHVTRQA